VISPVRPARESSFCPTPQRRCHPPLAPRARPPFTPPCRSFWSAFAELIRDLMSPTDFCNCVTTCELRTRALVPRRDGGLDLLPFLTHHALSLAEAVMRGEPRCARPAQPRCRFLLLAQVCPTAIPDRTPHLPTFCGGSLVRIDAHGSKDRAKDASPRCDDDLSCRPRVHALCGACRRRSPPRRPSDIRCHRRDCTPGGYPRHSPDRPRPPF